MEHNNYSFARYINLTIIFVISLDWTDIEGDYILSACSFVKASRDYIYDID